MAAVCLWATAPTYAVASAPRSDAEAQARRLLGEIEEAVTPRQRYLARKHAAELADRFPSCESCRRAYARVLQRCGLWYDAARQWRRLLKLRENDPEALLSLADHHVAEGLRYVHMVSGPISLATYGDEDLEAAFDYLTRLRQTPGSHGTAEMRLAELAVALGRWDTAIRHATSAALFGGEPNAHALLGAALWREGDPEEAAREFAVFLESAPDSARALYNDPDFFFSRRGLDLRRLDQPTPAEDSAWDHRDPRLLTQENERLLEHYARITIASVRCRSRPGAWDGHRTEPGVLLIRFGEPVEQTRIRPEITDDGSLRYEELRYHYPEFTIALDDRSLLGRFHLAGAGRRDSLSFVEGVRLIKRLKERYDPHDGELPLAMAARSWVLPRGDGGLAVAAVDIPTRGVEFQWDGHTPPYARFSVATRWRCLESGESRRASERFETDRIRGCTESPGFSAAFVETLTAGEWEFSLEVEDRSTGTWARVDTTLLVSPPSSSRLLLSGPIPCWVGENPVAGGIPLETTDLIPAALPAYGSLGTLAMYFEVHGMTPARWNIHQGSITYAVRRTDERSWWRKVFGGRRGTEVSVETEIQGPGTSLFSTVEVQLPPVPGGAYQFHLRCIDDVVGATATGQEAFLVCGQGE